MKNVVVSIDSIDKVKRFVNAVSKFPVDFDLRSERYIVDAKSIMGILSMNLSKPIELSIHSDSDKEIKSILAALGEFVIKA